MKNKKGFTLVELLAVIVILALIMSIAVISIGGVLNSTRQSTFKETAVSIINGVRQQLIVANELSEGDYVFTKALLEKGGDESPLGGTLKVYDSLPSTCTATNKIGDYICRTSTSNTAGSCGVTGTTPKDTTYSFVHVKKDGNVFTYSICLTAGMKDSATANKYIDPTNGTETNLLNSNNTTMILPA